MFVVKVIFAEEVTPITPFWTISNLVESDDLLNSSVNSEFVYNLKSNAEYESVPLVYESELSYKSNLTTWLEIIDSLGLTRESDPEEELVKSITSGISLVAL